MLAFNICIDFHAVLVDSLNAAESLDGKQQVILELLAVAIVVVLVVVELIDIVFLTQLLYEPHVIQDLLVHLFNSAGIIDAVGNNRLGQQFRWLGQQDGGNLAGAARSREHHHRISQPKQATAGIVRIEVKKA